MTREEAIDWGCELPKSEPIPSPELQKFIDMELFRMEAAKDILCAILSTKTTAGDSDIVTAIEIADELIKQLKEE